MFYNHSVPTKEVHYTEVSVAFNLLISKAFKRKSKVFGIAFLNLEFDRTVMHFSCTQGFVVTFNSKG